MVIGGGRGVGGFIPVFDLGGTVLEVPAPVRLHLSLVYKFLALSFCCIMLYFKNCAIIGFDNLYSLYFDIYMSVTCIQ